MIFVSAGHHPEAPGACENGFCEHDEAVRWVAEILKHLDDTEAAAVPVGSLGSKTRWINARDPLIAVEVHFNSLIAGQTIEAERGCMTLYCPGSTKGRWAAEVVHSGYAPLFPPDLGVREGYYRLDPKRGPDWFLAKTRCPALILEPEFIDRREEIAIKRADACYALAEALRRVVVKLKEEKRG